MAAKKQSPYIDYQDEWKQLYDSGLSFTEIAKRYGVVYSTVQTVLRGVVKPRPKQQYASYAKKWAKMYNEGYSSNEIAEKDNVSVNTVTKYLKKEGVELRRQVVREREYEHLTNTWIGLYNSGKSLKEIAEQYETTPQTVHKYIKDKTEMRWYTETSRQFEINESIFDVIDNDEKAYWLGLMFSTGSIINDINGGGIQLSISIKDIDRVEGFQNFLETEKEIKTIKHETYHQAFIRIHNKHLYEVMLSHGLESNKNQSLCFPKHINDKYLSAFILGYFEGRGSVYNSHSTIKGRTYITTYVSIFGTNAFLEGFKDKIKEMVDIDFYYTHLYNNFGNGYEEKDIHSLNIGRRSEVEKFALWLYTGKQEYSKRRDIREYLKQRELKIQELREG